MTTQKITLDHIKTENKKFDEKVKVQLDNKFHVHIFPNFDPTKIASMLRTLIKDYVELESGKKKTKTELTVAELVILYTTVTFSDIATMPNSLSTRISLFHELAKTPYLSTIYNQFPSDSKKQIELAIEGYTKTLETSQKEMTEKIAEMQDRIADKVEKLTSET